MQQHRRYYVERTDPLALSACLLMLLSFGVRLFYFWRVPPQSTSVLIIHALLPLSCCLLYAVLLPLCGKRALAVTALPVVLGVAFFMLKALSFAPLHRTLCMLLYLAVAVLYGATVTGRLPTQKLLIPLFGLPLLFHLGSDVRALLRGDPRAPIEWLPELSVLLMMAALLCASLAMRRRRN